MVWQTARFVLDAFGAAALLALVVLGVAQLTGVVTFETRKHDDKNRPQ